MWENIWNKRRNIFHGRNGLFSLQNMFDADLGWSIQKSVWRRLEWSKRWFKIPNIVKFWNFSKFWKCCSIACFIPGIVFFILNIQLTIKRLLGIPMYYSEALDEVIYFMTAFWLGFFGVVFLGICFIVEENE